MASTGCVVSSLLEKSIDLPHPTDKLDLIKLCQVHLAKNRNQSHNFRWWYVLIVTRCQSNYQYHSQLPIPYNHSHNSLVLYRKIDRGNSTRAILTDISIIKRDQSVKPKLVNSFAPADAYVHQLIFCLLPGWHIFATWFPERHFGRSWFLLKLLLIGSRESGEEWIKAI